MFDLANGVPLLPGRPYKGFPRHGGISSGMWQLPKAISLVAGHGEGSTELNAFDRALQDAGVADINFLRVTSVMPPGARVIELPPYPAGLLLPAVYARLASSRPGDRISAAIGVGVCRDRYGVIMEHTGHGGRAEAEIVVRAMVQEGLRIRGLEADEVITIASEHTVGRSGCVVALALFWPTPTGVAG
jgi:arginine decarboxylase